MADNFKEIMSNIAAVLKSASDDLIQKIARILIEDIGIESIEDLQLVKDEDLQSLGLKPLQKQKLLLAWQPKGNAYKSVNYILLIDGYAVNENIENFLDRFLMLFVAYFNIKYSEMASCTLEFIQRCFFSINPTQGAKHSKKNVRNTVQPKVSTLVSFLDDFEWL